MLTRVSCGSDGFERAWSMGIEPEVRSRRSEVRSQRTEDRGQMTASQMVNLSNGQMGMNGVNDGLTIS